MPGLGWLLRRELYKEELEPRWPTPDKVRRRLNFEKVFFNFATVTLLHLLSFFFRSVQKKVWSFLFPSALLRKGRGFSHAQREWKREEEKESFSISRFPTYRECTAKKNFPFSCHCLHHAVTHIAKEKMLSLLLSFPKRWPPCRQIWRIFKIRSRFYGPFSSPLLPYFQREREAS